ncbi:hypothetical protein R6Q59_006157 [Mikania micrantha]
MKELEGVCNPIIAKMYQDGTGEADMGRGMYDDGHSAGGASSGARGKIEEASSSDSPKKKSIDELNKCKTKYSIIKRSILYSLEIRC